MSRVQTNNDPELLQSKIEIRLFNLPKKSTLNILDAFAGEGILWGRIKISKPKINFRILHIDKNTNSGLKGNNLKFLPSLDLSKFDIIDLDAYGSPFDQLEIIFNKKYKGIIHCTFIQSMYGGMNKKLLNYLGYTDKMIDKIPSLFNKKGVDKFYNYLWLRGIKVVNCVQHKRKNYITFKTNGK